MDESKEKRSFFSRLSHLFKRNTSDNPENNISVNDQTASEAVIYCDDESVLEESFFLSSTVVNGEHTAKSESPETTISNVTNAPTNSILQSIDEQHVSTPEELDDGTSDALNYITPAVSSPLVSTNPLENGVSIDTKEDERDYLWSVSSSSSLWAKYRINRTKSETKLDDQLNTVPEDNISSNTAEITNKASNNQDFLPFETAVSEQETSTDNKFEEQNPVLPLDLLSALRTKYNLTNTMPNAVPVVQQLGERASVKTEEVREESVLDRDVLEAGTKILSEDTSSRSEEYNPVLIESSKQIVTNSEHSVSSCEINNTLIQLDISQRRPMANTHPVSLNYGGDTMYQYYLSGLSVYRTYLLQNKPVIGKDAPASKMITEKASASKPLVVKIPARSAMSNTTSAAVSRTQYIMIDELMQSLLQNGARRTVSELVTAISKSNRIPLAEKAIKSIIITTILGRGPGAKTKRYSYYSNADGETVVFLSGLARTEQKPVQNEIEREPDPAEEKMKEPKATSVTKETQEEADPLLCKLKERNVKYIDRRTVGGCLWLVGNYYDLSVFIDKLKEDGYIFKYKPDGSRASDYKPSWWLAKSPEIGQKLSNSHVRIPWTQHETALLIDSYHRIKNGEVSRSAEVKSLECLRSTLISSYYSPFSICKPNAGSLEIRASK